MDPNILYICTLFHNIQIYISNILVYVSIYLYVFFGEAILIFSYLYLINIDMVTYMLYVLQPGLLLVRVIFSCLRHVLVLKCQRFNSRSWQYFSCHLSLCLNWVQLSLYISTSAPWHSKLNHWYNCMCINIPISIGEQHF